jgi:hypothetical protein
VERFGAGAYTRKVEYQKHFEIVAAKLRSHDPVRQKLPLLSLFSKVRLIFRRFIFPLDVRLGEHLVTESSEVQSLTVTRGHAGETAKPQQLYRSLWRAHDDGDITRFRETSKDLYQLWMNARSIILNDLNHRKLTSAVPSNYPAFHHFVPDFDHDIDAGDLLIKEMQAEEVLETKSQGIEA